MTTEMENSGESVEIRQRVVVGNAPQPLDASLLQMELEAHEISSEQEGEYTLAVDPILSNAIGGIRIVVDASNEARAREVLENYYGKRREDEDAQARTCPACGAQDAEWVRRPLWIALLIVLTLGLLSLLYPWPRYACKACGHRWR